MVKTMLWNEKCFFVGEDKNLKKKLILTLLKYLIIMSPKRIKN